MVLQWFLEREEEIGSQASRVWSVFEGPRAFKTAAYRWRTFHFSSAQGFEMYSINKLGFVEIDPSLVQSLSPIFFELGNIINAIDYSRPSTHRCQPRVVLSLVASHQSWMRCVTTPRRSLIHKSVKQLHQHAVVRI